MAWSAIVRTLTLTTIAPILAKVVAMTVAAINGMNMVSFDGVEKETPTVHPSGIAARETFRGCLGGTQCRSWRWFHWGQMKAAPVAYDVVSFLPTRTSSTRLGFMQRKSANELLHWRLRVISGVQACRTSYRLLTRSESESSTCTDFPFTLVTLFISIPP